MLRRFSIWWLLPVVVLLDQLTKLVATQLNLVHLNSGIAFGWGQNMRSLWLSLLVLVVCLFLCWRLQRENRLNLGLILILAGGLSNFLDRLWLGGVRDFISLIWWRNNLADLAIVLGLLQLIIQLIFMSKSKYQTKSYV